MKITIYHNPRCSKSRQTLALLNENNVEPEIVEYLSAPLDAKLIRGLLERLGVGIRDIMRSGESVYKELNLGDSGCSEDELIAAIVENPILLQRPIVVKDDRAVVGRPPENILELL